MTINQSPALTGDLSATFERTNPRIFHIHADIKQTTPKTAKAFFDLGFFPAHFTGHPEGFEHFEPNEHLTFVTKDPADFKSVWRQSVAIADAGSFTGYLEGEFIPDDDLISFKPYNGADVPFHLTYRNLKGVDEGEAFRQAEIHLTFDKDESDPALIQKLLEAGLYGAYMKKPNGHTYLVLTAQGKAREIQTLYKVLKDFVAEAGGLSLCTLKNERAVCHAIYGVGPENMPKVIDNITYG